ncbi:hypothetical protein OURE66S_04121 [Oligella ureolytica]
MGSDYGQETIWSWGKSALEQLTQAEHLRAAKTFDEIRTRIIIARNEGLSSLNAKTDDSSTKKIKSDDEYEK